MKLSVNSQDLNISNVKRSHLLNVTNASINLWHIKLGHLSDLVWKLVLQSMNFHFDSKATNFFHSWKMGKLHKLPFLKHEITMTKPLEIVYSKLWGPSPYISTQGHKYYITLLMFFQDLLGFFLWNLNQKHCQFFRNFKMNVELQLNTKI